MRPQTQAQRRIVGFTLVEILLALALSAIVGLTVMLMLSALESSTRVENDTRRASMKRQVVLARLGNAVRGSAMVLASSAEAMVLWRADANGDEVPNLSELVRLTWDSGSGEVWAYEAPDDLDPGSDISYALTDDFDAITTGLAGTADYPGALLLTGVTAWGIALDDVDPQAAKLVRVAVTVDYDSGPETATIITALRASAG